MKKINILIALIFFIALGTFIISNSVAKQPYPYFSCYNQGGDPSCWRANGCYGNWATGVGCTLFCYWDENSEAGEADCGW